ncbi:MAG: STAS domain-containing protein [Pseudomonadota bacterium]|nr:STAS domain-containing protein [Pseudomonadota bacterium]
MLLLPATLTAREANDTRRLLAQAMSAASTEPAVLVDASNLRHFDSAALAVLLDLQRAAEGSGKPFMVRRPPAKLFALAHLYGVDTLLMPPGPVVETAAPPA